MEPPCIHHGETDEDTNDGEDGDEEESAPPRLRIGSLRLRGNEWERGHQSEGTEGETTPHRTSTRTFGYQRSPEPSFTFGRVGFVMLERFDHQRGAHGPNDADGPAVIQGLIEIMNGVLGSQ